MDSINAGRSGRWKLTVPGIALLVYAACCLLWWTEKQWRPEWDSAIYLLTGRSLAAGEGYTYLGRPFFLRPPGFSWLLSFFVREGAYDLHAMNRLVMFFAATAVTGIFFALRRVSTIWIALAVALSTGTCALFTRNFNWVVAEFPFLTLLFLAIGFLEPAARNRPGRWIGSACGAVSLAAALYLRTAAIVLLPALVLAGLRHGGRRSIRRSVPLVVLVILLVLPWWYHAHRSAAEAERPSDQLLLFSYSTAVWHVDAGDPDSARIPLSRWIERFEQNGVRIARDVAAVSFHSRRPWAAWAVALVVVAGWALRFRKRPSLVEWFAPIYVAVLLGYFTYDPRLALPLIPLVYLYLLAVVSFVAERIAGWMHRPRLATGTVAVAAGLLLAANLPNVARSPRWSTERFPELAEWIRLNTFEDAVILCHQAPIVEFLSGRRSYTYRFARGRDLLAKYDVDYVVMYPHAPPRLTTLVEDRALERREVAGRQVIRVRKP